MAAGKQTKQESSPFKLYCTILFISQILTIFLLIATNWYRIRYGFHLLSNKIIPSNDLRVSDDLLKERLKTKLDTLKNDPATQIKINNISRRVTVYFKNETSTDTIQTISDELANTYKIEAMTYVSKEDALKQYKEMFKDKKELTEFVTADIMPASLQFQVIDQTYLTEIKKILEKNNRYIESVTFGSDYQKSIENFINGKSDIFSK